MLLLGPGDAAGPGAATGDRVRVHNDSWRAGPAPAHRPRPPAGLVVAVNGWERQSGGTVNLLSEGRETDMGHGAAFHDNLVEVEKAP